MAPGSSRWIQRRLGHPIYFFEGSDISFEVLLNVIEDDLSLV
jgi:hypothetical protein